MSSRKQFAEFAGNERYEIVRRLGEGAMGVVYEAYDRERDGCVALKQLRRANPGMLYRFKQEFRLLADVSHPNLATLYELFADGDTWFLTMELIHGVDFLRYVRTGPGFADDKEAFAAIMAPSSSRDPSTPLEPTYGDELSTHPLSEPEQFQRLEDTLAQLADGIHALHRFGKLHRDIKPSNVRVTPEGRVVLLDFGLVTETESGQGAERELVGTPQYMSPEQAIGSALSPASDWYSVGCMLYHALTGQLPFVGSQMEIIETKQATDAPDAARLAPATPAHLHGLCRTLLERDPDKRPIGLNIMYILGAATGVASAELAFPPQTTQSGIPLVGREQQLAVLEDALDDVRQGQAVVTLVQGRSGIGKSALVREFLDAISRGTKPPLILVGRCYERESMPFKAVDSLIDALTKALRQFPPPVLAEFLSPDLVALGRLFPVLWRIKSLSRFRNEEQATRDPQELRRQAFDALRGLCSRLAEHYTLLFYIDDIHWGDADSAALFSHLLRAPDAPPMLLIACKRSDDESELSHALLGSSLLRRIDVGPLTLDDTVRLAQVLLPEHARDNAERLAKEARGNPFLIIELARYLQGRSSGRNVSLNMMLRDRIKALPESPRSLLQTIAVAGRPLTQAIVARASNVGKNPRSAMATLRAARLVRTHGQRDTDTVSTYHDRIREVVVDEMTPNELAEQHRALANELSIAGQTDAEAISEHYNEAGDRAASARFASLAASQAAETLAFDRAARLFARTLAIGEHDQEMTLFFQRRLGDALAHTGRGSDAADVYLAAAKHASSADRLEFKRKAAEQYLSCGFVDPGLKVLRSVLDEVGMRLPSGRLATSAAIMVERARLAVARKEDRTTEEKVPLAVLARIDACWAAAIGLTFVDNPKAFLFGSRHMRLALAAGEPYRVARGLALEAGFASVQGGQSLSKVESLLREAKELSRKLRDPHLAGLLELMRGLGPACTGDWNRSCEHYRRSSDIFREECTGAHSEKIYAAVWLLVPLFYQGDIKALRDQATLLMELGTERSNRFYEMSARTGNAIFKWLADDDIAGAREAVTFVKESAAHDRAHMQHSHALARAQLYLYQGDAQRAWDVIAQLTPAIKNSGVLKLQRVRVESTFLLARSAAALGAAGTNTTAHFATAEREAASLEREGIVWATGLAHLVRASVARARGDDQMTAEQLTSAAIKLYDADMHLFAAVAKRQRGLILGGSKGGQLIDDADRWMTDQSIVNPARMAATLSGQLPSS